MSYTASTQSVGTTIAHRAMQGRPCARSRYGTAKSTFSSLRLHAVFLEAPNNVRFVHNAALPYHPPFRTFRYHPGAARSPLKPVGAASGC